MKISTSEAITLELQLGQFSNVNVNSASRIKPIDKSFLNHLSLLQPVSIAFF